MTGPSPAMTTLVTLSVGGQLCGVPVEDVRDVLHVQAITRIPLARPEIAGSLNLRGRIVTAIDLRRRLGLAPALPDSPCMNLVTEHEGDLYALQVDGVREVVSLAADLLEPNPPTLPRAWAQHSAGIFQMPDGLLVMLDLGRLLDLGLGEVAR